MGLKFTTLRSRAAWPSDCASQVPLFCSLNNTVNVDCQVWPRTGMHRHYGIRQCSLGTGYQLLQRLLTAIAVDQQHFLDPVLLEAHVTELFPEAQELPCLRKGKQRECWGLCQTSHLPVEPSPWYLPYLLPQSCGLPKPGKPDPGQHPLFFPVPQGDIGLDLPSCARPGHWLQPGFTPSLQLIPDSWCSGTGQKAGGCILVPRGCTTWGLCPSPKPCQRFTQCSLDFPSSSGPSA